MGLLPLQPSLSALRPCSQGLVYSKRSLNACFLSDLGPQLAEWPRPQGLNRAEALQRSTPMPSWLRSKATWTRRQGSYWGPRGLFPTQRGRGCSELPVTAPQGFPGHRTPQALCPGDVCAFALRGPEDSPPDAEPEAACAAWGAWDPAGWLREAQCPPYSKSSGRAESEPDWHPQSRPRICVVLPP